MCRESVRLPCAPVVALVRAVAFCFVCSFALTARAETLQAPFGGKPVPLGVSRVACGQAPAGWTVVSGGAALRPPDGEASIGTSGELRVAPNAEGCAASNEHVHLLVVGRRPVADPASIVLYPDAARLEAHGRKLKRAVLYWQTTTASGSSSCKSFKMDQGGEQCTWDIGRGLSASPDSVTFAVLPEGAQFGDDVTSYDVEGARVDPDDERVTPARVVLDRVAPPDAAVDLSAGRGEVKLVHPEVTRSAQCTPAHCEIAGGTLLIRGLASEVSSVDVKVELAPHVFLQTPSGFEAQPLLHWPVLRCPMTVVSGAPLRETSSARLVVHVGGGCGRDTSILKFEVAGTPRDPLASVPVPDGADVLLAVGNTDANSIGVTALLANDPSVVVATARTDTRDAPPINASVGIPGHANLDFIPNNRSAVVHTREEAPGLKLAVLSVPGVYQALDPEAGVIQGDPNAAGTTTLRFGVRAESLPGALRAADLAVLHDAVQRAIRPANLAAPLGEFAPPGQALVELVCGRVDAPELVAAGATVHFPYAMRDDCRVVFHRERLSPTYGAQKLKLAIDVVNPDGVSRGDAHVAETLVVQAGNRPLFAWIHGVAGRFDRAVVRVSHVADETHYLGASELTTDTPEVKWTIIFGTGSMRLYATSTIPTGLYRFGDPQHSGPLSLNLGIISRLTWLDSEGHEGFIGFEGGIVAFGLTNDHSTTGQPLTHVGVVAGLGIGVPVANRSSPTEASINLHGWYERDVSQAAGTGNAFVFGPSISIGNVGANL